jgi:iron complex outermembrane receptor protein
MSISRLLSPGVSGAASTFTRARLVSSVAAALAALSGAQAMGQEEERIGGYSLQLEEVVVTAQKREESYMSVPVTVNAFTAQDMVNTGDFTNWGVFADLTYQLTETLSLAGGLRYSADEKDYSWQTNPSTVDWPFAPVRLVYDPAETGADPADYFNKFSDSESWSKVTGRLVANWEFSDTAMTYLSYATGYKSGGYDGQSFARYVTGPFDPEDMANIELGLKGDFFNDSVRLEVAL